MPWLKIWTEMATVTSTDATIILQLNESPWEKKKGNDHKLLTVTACQKDVACD